jgi:C4-dicarboxylate-specific signal transduction histidine kinase
MLIESFAQITNSLAEPHFLLASDGSIISANQEARKKIIAVNSNVEATNLSMLMVDGIDRLKQLMQMWSRSKSPLPASIRFRSEGEEPVNYLCKGNLLQPALNGESALIMMHCTDMQQSSAVFITLNENIEQLKREIIERRNAEQTIRNMNRDLEQRVSDRTTELQQANSEIKSSLDELKNAQNHLARSERLASLGSMVAGVAHEINTPIGVCITSSSYLDEQTREFLKRYKNDALTREGFESFLHIVSESSSILNSNLMRAADLVGSFKQLAVDQTSDESRHINLKRYIEELMISLNPYFRHTNHRFEFNCPDDIDIVSQPGAIAQIFTNLISNTMLHGFEGIEQGLIKIEVKREQDRVQLHYSDNGNGVTKENLSQIFDPFFTTKRNQGGSGLGMSIVYNLVTNKLGGDIRATSEPQQGIHFYISLG